MKLAISLAALSLVGCFDQSLDTTSTAQPLASGLMLERVTPTDVSGIFVDGDVTVSFAGHAGTTIAARLAYTGTSITIIYDPTVGDAGTVTTNLAGPLDGAHRLVLADLSTALDRAFPAANDPAQKSGALLRTYAGFFSEWRHPRATTSTAVPPLPRRDSDGTNEVPTGSSGGTSPPPYQISDDDGVTLLPQCCNGGTIVPWQHDADTHCFVTMNDMCGKNSATSLDPLATNCPGRCGPGCTGISVYTQDCLDHDLCLMHHPGASPYSDSSSDPCGDEFDDAIDDVAFVYASGIGYLYVLGCQE